VGEKPFVSIVFDTETTGLSPRSGHRIVEFGLVELVNYKPSGRSYHAYINPERDVPIESYNVHGLSYDFLRDKPVFDRVVDDILDFMEPASEFVAHNARFDMDFMNAELRLCGIPPLSGYAVVDTYQLSRSTFNKGKHSLDALCERFGIKLDSRKARHGALIDSELLAQCYMNLRLVQPPRQFDFGGAATAELKDAPALQRPAPLPSTLTQPEIDAHEEAIKTLPRGRAWGKYGRGKAT